MTPTRNEALSLLKQHNQSEQLLKHAYAVEATLRHFAVKANEDPEKWGIIGLLHDVDFEKYPQEHCIASVEILRNANYPEEYIRAIQSHGWTICTDVEPLSFMENVLFTIDELTGLIIATALMRPTKSLSDLEYKSVKNKWKDKRFAAGVNRGIIEQGAKRMNMELSEIISETILALRPIEHVLGLGSLNH